MEQAIEATVERAEEEPLTRAEVERQLSEMAQRLTRQIEAGAQAEDARQQALNTREAELRRRELAALARETLEKRGLPVALAEALPFQEETALNQGIDALEEAFRAAVQRGVEERLFTSAPKKAAIPPLSQLSDEDYYAAVCRREE